ncbi:hypothetical protein OIU74_001914 [Salix koriyanagi]|uniref:Uncharacterized protein n=1 Tax=Salix koriyanagi TaxID=2511006 RepID=A0A9Q1ANL3_9ROSI|nr:hypothetical protein OIU74_001914 [Salix koriyanagi]
MSADAIESPVPESVLNVEMQNKGIVDALYKGLSNGGDMGKVAKLIAKGWEGAQVYWVHVWTLKDNVITQFREYFNTWLTVKDISPHGWEIRHENHTLWRSHPRDLFKRSLPGLILGI